MIAFHMSIVVNLKHGGRNILFFTFLFYDSVQTFSDSDKTKHLRDNTNKRLLLSDCLGKYDGEFKPIESSDSLLQQPDMFYRQSVTNLINNSVRYWHFKLCMSLQSLFYWSHFYLILLEGLAYFIPRSWSRWRLTSLG